MDRSVDPTVHAARNPARDQIQQLKLRLATSRHRSGEHRKISVFIRLRLDLEGEALSLSGQMNQWDKCVCCYKHTVHGTYTRECDLYPNQGPAHSYFKRILPQVGQPLLRFLRACAAHNNFHNSEQ